jgi:hypothetical protein
MFINNGAPLLSSQSISEIKTVVGDSLIHPYSLNPDNNSSNQLPSRRFGLCWHWRTLSNGHQYLGHGGTLPGMTHLMLINEKHTIGVIVLTNADTNSPIDLTRQIFETIENTHMSLFKCFETNSGISIVFHIQNIFFSVASVFLFSIFRVQ